MPFGIDFTCKNKECEHCGKTITMLGPWPVGDIDLVIDGIQDLEFKQEMTGLREQGDEFACIQYPNVRGIEGVGWKLARWCSNCPRMGFDNIMVTEDNQDFADALKVADIPEKCPYVMEN